MGYVLLLFLCISSLQSMEADLEDRSLPEKAANLLEKIKAANVDAVREILLHGVRPHSRVVDVGRDSEHHVNVFVTSIMQLDDAPKRFEMLRLLLEHGAHQDHSVQFGSGTSQKMPILSYVIERFGIRNNIPQEALLLLAHGANLNEEDFAKNRPLNHAWRVGNPDVFKALCLSGAQPIDLDEEPLSDDIRLLMTDVEQYKSNYPDECAPIQEKIALLRAERLSRKRKIDEKFSVDHDIPRSPRSSPRKVRRKDD